MKEISEEVLLIKQTTKQNFDVTESTIFELFERLANFGERMRKLNGTPNEAEGNQVDSCPNNSEQDQK